MGKALELIRSRRSFRSFDGRNLSDGEQEEILNYAKSVETPYQLPIEWRILNAGQENLSVPVITGTDLYIAGKMKRAPHAEEAFGFGFERVVLFAQSKGIGTTWIAGTMDRKAFERALELEAGEVMPCISPLGYPAKKMALKEIMLRKGVKADSRLAFEELFFEGGFDTPIPAERAGELKDTLEMVRWAPSAVNRQPWRLVVCGDTVHFFEKHGKSFISADGWDLQKIDVGIAMCHFVCGMEERGCTPEFFLEDPGFDRPAYTDYVASFRMTRVS